MTGELIAELVGFLVVLGVLWRYVLPPARRAMQQRQDAIRQQFEETKQVKQRLEEAEQRYQRALTDAQQQASQLREDARAQQQQILNEARDEAQQRVDAILSRTDADIAVRQQQASRRLHEEGMRETLELAERVVRAAMEDEGRQQRVTDRLVEELERWP